MIISFKHKGLEHFFLTGSTSGIQPKHAKKLGDQLTLLNVANQIEVLNVPGFGLHKLKGKRKDTWSIIVNGNWRLTFEFEDGNVYVLNYEDYH